MKRYQRMLLPSGGVWRLAIIACYATMILVVLGWRLSSWIGLIGLALWAYVIGAIHWQRRRERRAIRAYRSEAAGRRSIATDDERQRAS